METDGGGWMLWLEYNTQYKQYAIKQLEVI